jgi:hypothetical protein
MPSLCFRGNIIYNTDKFNFSFIWRCFFERVTLTVVTRNIYKILAENAMETLLLNNLGIVALG